MIKLLKHRLVCYFFLTLLIGGTNLSVVAQELTGPKKPLMGWASWNNFRVNISEAILVEQADAMVYTGLKEAGYEYINVDDGFFNGRNPDGSLRTDSLKFPVGMKRLADNIHARGLKAGIYSEAGINTCGSIYDGQIGGLGVGLYRHEQQDMDTIFKRWGYDYIKVDYCGGLRQELDEKTQYTAIRQAIDHTGKKDIVFNVCRWQFPGTWVTGIANSWRISGDISASWSSVMSILDQNTYLAAYVSPGHYNDMDMLEVGRGMSAEEDKSHFSLWCILSSPLVLGNDLTTLSTTTKNILTNAEMLAVNQDTTGLQAQLLTDNGAGLQVWAKNLNGKQSLERVVLLLNRTSGPAKMSVNWTDLNLVGACHIRNLWSHNDLGMMDAGYTTTVPSHGVVVLKVIGKQSRLQETFEAEYAWINHLNLSQNSNLIPNQGKVVLDPSCSGRAKAGWLGKDADNFLEFKNIYADSSQNYQLTIDYIGGENRSINMSINGKDSLLNNLNSGSWFQIGQKKITVYLQKGCNIVRFSNATGWMPDIDKIHLTLNKQNQTNGLIENQISKKTSIHPNPCTPFFRIESNTPLIQASLYTMSGYLLGNYTQSVIPVSNLSSGYYLLNVTTGKESSTLLVSKK